MTVSALYRYPVKSMLGEPLTRAVLDERGVLGDRAYALLDVESGTVASAKVPRWWSALLGFSAAYAGEPVPGEAPPPVEITFPDGSVRRSDDADLDTALSGVLGREVALVTVPPQGAMFEELWPGIEGLAPERLVEATTARHEETGEAISRFEVGAFSPGRFHDLAPVHVVTRATLDRLGELAPDSDFDPRRYRPNIVLDDGTGPGFVENDWPGTEMALGDEVRVAYSFATMRCVMTTLGQGELPEDRDTLRTIAKHNRIPIPQIGGVWACAGVYADVRAGGEVALGAREQKTVLGH